MGMEDGEDDAIDANHVNKVTIGRMRRCTSTKLHSIALVVFTFAIVIWESIEVE